MAALKSTILFLIIFFASCQSREHQLKQDSSKLKLQTSIPDTTKGWLAKDQFNGYMERKRLTRIFGLSDLELSNDNEEVRIWWQASIYSPSRVWRFRNYRDSLTVDRIDFYLDYPGSKVDSFRVIPEKLSIKSKLLRLDSMTFSSIWSIPQYYEKKHKKGCVDGENVSLEARSDKKYKTVSYPCYILYKDSTEYQFFSSLVNRFLNFQDGQ